MSDDVKFNEQSFLLDFFTEIVTRNTDGNGNYKNYSNFIQVTGDSVGLMNRLLLKGNPNALWNLSSAQLSMLVPRISIYKIAKDEDGKQVQKMFRFNEPTTEADILKSRLKRGSDVALQSFTWNDIGTNPGDTGLSFEATMKLGFQSFEGVFKERGEDLRFSDLLIPSKMNSKDATARKAEISEKLLSDGETRKIDPTDFQIKAVLGWAVPSDPGRAVFDPGFNMNDILSTQVALLLTLTSHDIDVKEDGTVDITINYMAAIEGRAMSPKQDLLKIEGDVLDITGVGLAEERRRLKSFINRESAAIKRATGRTSEEIAEDKRLIENKKEKVREISAKLSESKSRKRKEAYGRILNQIEGTGTCTTEQRRIFFIELNKEQVSAYNDMNSQSFSEIKDSETRKASIRKYRKTRKAEIKSYSKKKDELLIQKSVDSERASMLTDLNDLIAKIPPNKRKDTITEWKKNNPDKVAIQDTAPLVLNYFYFGDLIDAALQVLKDNAPNKEIKEFNPVDTGFLMGTINLYNADKDKIVTVPLCDIPISLNVFQSWFVKTIIEPNVTKLPFLTFLRRAISTLITGALSPNSFGGLSKKAIKTKLSLSSFLAHKNALTKDSSTSGRINTSAIGKNISQSAVTADISKLIQYNFVYVGGELSKRLKADELEDGKLGIFHAYIARDKGLIKKINFNRTDLPFQREARILGNKDTANSNLLFSDHYNAEISMVGNAIFKPGMLLFINPTGLGLDPLAKKESTIQGSWSSKLGIGGYYLVIKVENIIESGKFETNLSLVSEMPLYKMNKVEVFSQKAQDVVTIVRSPPNPKRSVSVPATQKRTESSIQGETRTTRPDGSVSVRFKDF